MKRWRSVLCLLLALVTLLPLVPVNAAAAAPSITVSQENVKINRAVSDTARVEVSFAGDLPDGCYWNLAAAGPFQCEWNEDDSFNIVATGLGTADLDVMLCREVNGQEEVVVKKTVHVTVVNETQTATTTPQTATAPAEKSSEDPEYTAWQEYYNKNKAFINATKNKREIQSYRVALVTGKDASGKDVKVQYCMQTGICNVDSYATLLNRFIALNYNQNYEYGIVSNGKATPITSKDVLEKVLGYKDTTIVFKGTSSSQEISKTVTTVGPFTRNGTTYKVGDKYGGKEITATTKKTWNEIKTVNKTPNYTYRVGHYYVGGGNCGYYTSPTKKFYTYQGHKIQAVVKLRLDTSTKVKKFSGTQPTPKELAALLRQYPAGVYVHAIRDGQGMHAVCVASYTYDQKTKAYTFTIADPAKKEFYTQKVTGQDSVLFGYNSKHQYRMKDLDVVFALTEK